MTIGVGSIITYLLKCIILRMKELIGNMIGNGVHDYDSC